MGENADSAAAEILQWFAAVDNAVMRMKLNGIAYEDMSFIYDVRYFSGAALNGYMHNTRCTTDTCRLFKTEGGGVKPPDFSQYGNWNATGSAPSNLGPGYIAPLMMRWPGAATDLNDVVIQIFYLNAAVCDAVKLKIAQTTTPSTSGTWISGVVFPTGTIQPTHSPPITRPYIALIHMSAALCIPERRERGATFIML